MRTLLSGARVFDGTGSDPLRADLVLDGGVIAEVLADGAQPSAPVEQTHHVAGHTILPGLIDCHVHATMSGADSLRLMQEPFSYQFYAAQRNLARTLDLGITTVRDAGGADLGIQVATAEGLIDGPDLRLAISILGQTGGHTDGWNVHGDVAHIFVPHPGRPAGIVDGPDEMRRRVRELVRAGANVIKICTTGGVLSPRDDPRHPQFAKDELEICVSEARAAGISVMAHAQGTQGILNAVRAGVRSIEHGIYADDRCRAEMLERGTWLVPTLLAPVALIRSIDAGVAVPKAVEDKARAVVDIHREAVAAAISDGVRIAMGTDAGVFEHGLNAEELSLMVDAGMTPAQALAAATSSAAELLELPDRGRIAVGLRADLVVVDGDPFAVATHAERVRMVLQQGRVVRNSLQQQH